MTKFQHTQGDLSQGAPMAGAIEPSGIAPDGHTDEAICLNCRTSLIGPHCHQCGQQAHVHRTLSAFFHDLAHGVFHFEGRIWRTLPMLVTHPGRLTRDYIAGRRATYVSPIAAFLFCAFVMFGAVHLGERPRHFTFDIDVAQSSGDHRAALTELLANRAKLVGTTSDTARSLDQRIATERKTLAELDRMTAAGLTRAPAAAIDGESVSDIPWLNTVLTEARTNPELLILKLETNAHKYTWALIPMSVPLLWLLFPFSRRYGLYDHTVFVTYSLSFMMVFVAALALGGLASLPYLAVIALVVPPWHIHRQLREAYALSRNAALWRAGVLIVGAGAVLLIFAAGLIAMGLTA